MIPVAQIVDHAAVIFKTTPKDIVSRSRLREHVRARQAVAFVAIAAGKPQALVARQLGIYHKTVAYSCDILPEYMRRDATLSSRVERLAAIASEREVVA